MERPNFFTLKNGDKVKLPFTNSEYDQRVNSLRTVMDKNNLFIVHLEGLMVVWLQKIKFQQFQQILMQANPGEDHIVIMLSIQTGREIIF